MNRPRCAGLLIITTWMLLVLSHPSLRAQTTPPAKESARAENNENTVKAERQVREGGKAHAKTTPRSKSNEGNGSVATKPPFIQSTVEAARTRKSSPFLRMPGEGRYDEGGIDWRDVPAWKQTSFFGIRARGQVFIYVVDCSGSMIDEERLVRAKAELRRSIMSLQHPQRFKVLFYNDRVIPMPGDVPRSADLASKGQLTRWLRLIEPDGETDPRGAMGMALSLRPDAVFLLSDGEFPEGTVESVARMNPQKVPIHCINLGGSEGGEQLQQIANASGGQYRARPSGGP